MSAVEVNKEVLANTTHLEAISSLDEKMHGKQLEVLAQVGAQTELTLTPWQAIKAYPMAVFWSLMVSMCVIMEGFDTILIGNFYAYPTFAQKYGHIQTADGTWQLSAAWQAGLGNASGVGAFFGVLINGKSGLLTQFHTWFADLFKDGSFRDSVKRRPSSVLSLFSAPPSPSHSSLRISKF